MGSVGGGCGAPLEQPAAQGAGAEGAGAGGAAAEGAGAEGAGAGGVARCALESATRLDALDVHGLQLEARGIQLEASLTRIAHEAAARDRQVPRRSDASMLLAPCPSPSNLALAPSP